MTLNSTLPASTLSLPLPAAFRYETEPRQHQRSYVEQHWDKEAWGLFFEQGTGKTKAFIDNAFALWHAGKIQRVMILLPKTLIPNWKREWHRHADKRVKCRVTAYHESVSKRGKARLDWILEGPKPDQLDVLFVGVEILSQRYTDARVVCEKFADRYLTLGGIDEATVIKASASTRTKRVHAFRDLLNFRRLLTGTPNAQSPLDVWSLFYFLEPSLMGWSEKNFRSRYGITEDRKFGNLVWRRNEEGKLVQKVGTTKVVVGYQRLDELGEKMASLSTRVTKKDCLDLPAKIYTERYVELTTQQRALYEKLARERFVELQDHQLRGTLTAVNAGSVAQKLLQIAAGVFIDDDGEGQWVSSNKPQVVVDLCAEASRKVLIWSNFLRVSDRLREVLAKEFGPESVGVYNGSTPMKEREALELNFQDPAHPLRYMVLHPKAGGYGLTLTQATTSIYYDSPPVEQRLQSEDRPHRMGQDEAVTYYDLVTLGTLEVRMHENRRAGKDLFYRLIDDWRSFLKPPLEEFEFAE